MLCVNAQSTIERPRASDSINSESYGTCRIKRGIPSGRKKEKSMKITGIVFMTLLLLMLSAMAVGSVFGSMMIRIFSSVTEVLPV